MCKIKEFMKGLSENTTMTKKEYFLTIATCLLGGIVLGILCSPKKHTVIGCNNGNNTDSNINWDEEDMWEDDGMWEDDMPDEILSFK